MALASLNYDISRLRLPEWNEYAATALQVGFKIRDVILAHA